MSTPIIRTLCLEMNRTREENLYTISSFVFVELLQQTIQMLIQISIHCQDNSILIVVLYVNIYIRVHIRCL